METEIKVSGTIKGTRILTGEVARKRRQLINSMIDICYKYGYEEIVIPIMEYSNVYIDKAGEEVLGQMYTFKDKSDRDLCLRPEGTATCQLMAKEKLKYEKNVKVFYITNCYRYERPQSGRYREFLQFGVEVLNPKEDFKDELIKMSIEMVELVTKNYEVSDNVKRGLSYYVGNGFEISCPELGAQKQVCGGGTYNEGIGFAMGVDRLMLLQ